MTLTVAVAFTTHHDPSKINICLPTGQTEVVKLSDLARLDVDLICTDRTIESLWEHGVGAYPHIKTNQWLSTPIHALLSEVTFTTNPPAVLTKIIERTINLIVSSFGQDVLESPVLSEAIAKNLYLKLHPTDESGIAQSSYNISTIMANSNGDESLVVRPNRAAHSRSVLSTPCNSERWIQVNKPTLNQALKTASISEIDSFNEAGDVDVKAFYAIGAGALRRQTMLTQPELCMAILRHQVVINKLWVADNPTQHPIAEHLPDAGCFTYSSLTIAMVHELLMVASTTMLPSMYYSAAPSILAAADRAYLLPTVVKLHSLGVKIIGYGQGKITIDPLAVSIKSLRQFCSTNQLTIATRNLCAKSKTHNEYTHQP